MAKNWWDYKTPNEILSPYSLESFGDKAARDAIAATYRTANAYTQRGQVADNSTAYYGGNYPSEEGYTCTCGILRSLFNLYTFDLFCPCRKRNK